jgi:prepilin-type N-terminal cleavage/methylation domain-containing protein
MSPRRAGPVPPLARRRARGFTLIEVMFALAIFSIAMVLLAQSQSESVESAVKALDLREVRIAGDTIFRRYVYELHKMNDGDSGGLDIWYGEYVGLRGAERDRWGAYRGVFHKKRMLVAGSDPSGKSESLFGSGSEPGTTSKTTTKTTSGSTSTSAAAADQTGEELYLLELDVFAQGALDENGAEVPVLTLRTLVPVPAAEQEEGK